MNKVVLSVTPDVYEYICFACKLLAEHYKKVKVDEDFENFKEWVKQELILSKKTEMQLLNFKMVLKKENFYGK
jgi:hypothetical protein